MSILLLQDYLQKSMQVWMEILFFIVQELLQHAFELYRSQHVLYSQGCRKLAPLAPPVPDKPHLVGQNEI
jgi:hypothetical protein